MNLFKDTIFDNDRPVKQSHFFEYSNIMIPLNFNTKLTLFIWEKLYEEYSNNESSLRNTDME